MISFFSKSKTLKPLKAVVVNIHDRGFNSFADNITLDKTKWTGLFFRLPELSRNRPLDYR